MELGAGGPLMNRPTASLRLPRGRTVDPGSVVDDRLGRYAALAEARAPVLLMARCDSERTASETLADRRKEQRVSRHGLPTPRCPVAWNAIAAAGLLLSTKAGARSGPIARRRTPDPRPLREPQGGPCGRLLQCGRESRASRLTFR